MVGTEKLKISPGDPIPEQEFQKEKPETKGRKSLTNSRKFPRSEGSEFILKGFNNSLALHENRPSPRHATLKCQNAGDRREKVTYKESGLRMA